MEKLEYEDDRGLFNIVYRHMRPGKLGHLNSEGAAARQLLLKRGYSSEEIAEHVKDMHRARR